MMALTKYEQETHVNMNREDEQVLIYTANAKHIRAIRKDDRFVIIDEYLDDDGEIEAIRVSIDSSSFDPITGLKRRSKPLSDEERQARVERLRAAREAKKNGE